MEKIIISWQIKRLFKVFIITIFLFSCLACGSGEFLGEEKGVLTLPEIVDKNESSTVFILTESSSGSSSGSGIVLDNEGHILTNAHVVSGASYKVRSPDGEMISAQMVGRAFCDDLAVVRVREKQDEFKSASMATTEPEVGEDVYAMGYPATADQNFIDTQLSVTKGIVSRKGASFDFFGLTNLLQIDAALNPGNSGGPLVNNHGKVVGVNTLGTIPELEGQNYSISIQKAKEIYSILLEGKDLDWIGVDVENIIFEDFSVLMVVGVDPGSDFEANDWYPGDIIMTVDGKNIYNQGDLCEIVKSKRSGDVMKFVGLYYSSYYQDFRSWESNITMP